MRWLNHVIWKLLVTNLRVFGLSNLRVYDAVVDVNGWGDYWQVDQAIDAGAISIFVRDGTYLPFTIDNANTQVTGASWATIIDGATTSAAIDVNGVDDCVIRNLQCKTTGGEGNAYDAITIGSGSDRLLIERVYIPDSDQHGINYESRADASYGMIRDCYITDTDNIGIYIQTYFTSIKDCIIVSTGSHGISCSVTGDATSIVGCMIVVAGNDGVLLDPGADNSLVAGCILFQCTNEEVDDNSGTSTDAANEKLPL
tara:strand:+ start:345 stop:1112 length:768 start_codon:yes stop_codon:yes gene_type:complete